MAAENNKKIDSEIGQALFSDTERFEMWFAAYWKPVTVVAVILAVLTAVVFWVATARSAAERKAAFELADAATEAELTAVLKKYPDHAGSAVARFRLAKLFLDAKKYQEALKELDAVANASGADATLAAQAKMAAGYACELSNNIKDAIPRFLAVESAIALPAVLRAEAGYCAGRLLLKSGNIKQAKTVLNRTSLLGNAPATVGYWTDNAKQTLIAIDNGEYKKAAPAKKAVAAKPAPVKKPVAKKPAAVKPAPVKKPVAKKPAAVKPAPVKKPVAKKPAAVKPAPVKKPVAKKPAAVKPAPAKKAAPATKPATAKPDAAKQTTPAK